MKYWLVDLPARIFETAITVYWYVIGLFGIVCLLSAMAMAAADLWGYSLQ